MSAVDTFRTPYVQCLEKFPIPHCRKHSIRLCVLPSRAPQFIWSRGPRQTVPTQKNSMTRIPAILISRRIELLNICHDPAHPVAKRIMKAIGSPSIFSVSFMKREKRRPRCGRLRCFRLCLASGLHGHMSVAQSIGGARIHSESCTFSIGE